jgi:hypothetical protein
MVLLAASGPAGSTRPVMAGAVGPGVGPRELALRPRRPAAGPQRALAAGRLAASGPAGSSRPVMAGAAGPQRALAAGRLAS